MRTIMAGPGQRHTMRPELASWMTPVDRAILERLYNEGNDELVLSPGLIAANIDYERPTIREHLMTLRERGLVAYYDEDRAIYQLTETGRGWVAGEIPTSDLES
jgi:DNA-binding transcriptional ArsR family regulator